ncbi:MAG: hypothetical protein ABI612_03350 [Betaproteobacteria bacterium]
MANGKATFIPIVTPPMIWDEQLGWAPKPHYSSYSGTFLIGEHGIRMNSEVITPLRQHAILAVGDSFTAGSEVGNSESWPAHLERLLGTQVINAASGAWGVDQMILRVEQLAPILHPKAVIVGILDQDILRNNYRLYGGGYKPYFTIEKNELILNGTPVPTFAGARSDLGFWKSIFGHFYALDWLYRNLGRTASWVDESRRYDKAHDNGPEISRLLMGRLARLKQQYDFDAMVVLLYGGDYAERFDKPADWVQPTFQGARDDGIPAIDMLPVLREAHAARSDALRQYYVMHDGGTSYGHMNSQGNLLVAKTISRRIRELRWQAVKR